MILSLRKARKFLRSHLRAVALSVCGLLVATLALNSCVSCVHTTLWPGKNTPSVAGVPLVRVKLSAPANGATISTSAAYEVRCGGRVVAEGGSGMPACAINYSGGRWYVGSRTFGGNDLVIEARGNGLVSVDQTWYRGSIRLSPQGGGYDVINHVDMESYLAGVLPKELLPSWSYETYRALAVAARTFAMYHMGSTGQAREYDVGDSEASQVYGGYTAEASSQYSRKAVDSTRGWVLTWRGRIMMAQYSAACGGRVNPAYVLRDVNAEGPLAGGQACDDCSGCSHYAWGPVTATKSELLTALKRRYPNLDHLGGLAGIEPVNATPWGRPVWIKLVGTSGQTDRLRADDLRLAWNMYISNTSSASTRRLYSMNCTMRDYGDRIQFADGRGFGHGVGLCQWGAEGKAQHGWKGEQIIGFYYPGAKIDKQY